MEHEQLIIKNFGPIKDVNLDLRKTTIFIGEQASGKSTLAKLIGILRTPHYFNPEISNEEIYSLILSEFTRVDLPNYFNDKTFINYISTNLEIILEKEICKVVKNKFDFKTSPSKILFELFPDKVKEILALDSQQEISKGISQMACGLPFPSR